MPRSSRRRRPVLLLALLGLAALGGAATGGIAAANPADPSRSVPALIGASAMGERPGTITVTGEAFTPGGRVYVALYDQWGATLHETRWVTASGTVYGPNWSADPAAGFSRGGVLREAFGDLCGATPMARAYDQATATWSNWLDADPGDDPGCGRRGYAVS